MSRGRVGGVCTGRKYPGVGGGGVYALCINVQGQGGGVYALGSNAQGQGGGGVHTDLKCPGAGWVGRVGGCTH